MWKWTRNTKPEFWAGVLGFITDGYILGTGFYVHDIRSVLGISLDVGCNVSFCWKGGQKVKTYSIGCLLGAAAIEVLSSSQATAGNPVLKHMMVVQGAVWSIGVLRYPIHRVAEAVKFSRPDLARKLNTVNKVIKVGLAYGSMGTRLLLAIPSGRGHNERILILQFLGLAADLLRGKPRMEEDVPVPAVKSKSATAAAGAPQL